MMLMMKGKMEILCVCTVESRKVSPSDLWW